MLMSRNRRASAGAMDLDQDCVEIGSNFISQTVNPITIFT